MSRIPVPAPERRHKTISLSVETLSMLEAIREQIPVPLSQNQVIHLALLALKRYENPLDAAKGPSTD